MMSDFDFFYFFLIDIKYTDIVQILIIRWWSQAIPIYAVVELTHYA